MVNLTFIKEFDNFKSGLKKQLESYFPFGSKIAIKLHMGEEGNKHFLPPKYAKAVYEVCTELGYNAFLFDSLVKYNAARHTVEGHLKVAKEHGFDFCDVVVSNESIKVKGKHLTYNVCKDLVDADGVVVLTHVKGHFCTGFGAAIKNVGMGAVSMDTKGDIHAGGEPEYIDGCTMCRECEKNCPTENIRYENNRPYFDKSWCCGCSNCSIVCPENAIKPKLAKFDVLIAESANAALKSFKKTFFINALVNISEKCDCWRTENRIIGEDIGILLGEDIVAIEKASLDLVKKENGKDIFKEVNHRDALLHIGEAEKNGMGTQSYLLQ